MKELVIERDGGVVTLTLNRPEKRNAVNVPRWEELGRLLPEIASRPEDRVLVLTGAGGYFCAGGDLSGAAQRTESARSLPSKDPAELEPIPDRDTAGSGSGFRSMRQVGAVCLALYQLPKPTIAAVGGVAAGAGANLAFGCDLVLASESARFGEVFVRRAVPIDTGGTWLLPRLIGLQKAKELAFFGDWVSAQEAQKIGLVNRVYPADKLDAEVRSWAQRLAEGPALALSLIKMGLNRSFETSLADTLDNEALALSFCTTTDDFREAMRVFPDKKTPRFGRP